MHIFTCEISKKKSSNAFETHKSKFLIFCKNKNFVTRKSIPFQVLALLTSNLVRKKIIVIGFSSKRLARLNCTKKTKTKVKALTKILAFSLQQWGFSKCSCHSSFCWLHSSFHRKKHFFFWKEREMQLYSPSKNVANTLVGVGFFFSSCWFVASFLDEKKIIERKLDQYAHFEREDFFKVTLGNFLKVSAI